MSTAESRDEKDEGDPPAIVPPDGILSTSEQIREIFARQERSIQAIEDAAYIVRQGKRMLKDPKLLALAVQLRSQQAADLRNSQAYLGDMARFNQYMCKMLLAYTTNIRNPEDRERVLRAVQDIDYEMRSGEKSKGLKNKTDSKRFRGRGSV